MKTSARFRAVHGQKLQDKLAAATPLSAGNKDADEDRVEDLAKQIAEYQDIFYAERSRKILIILQGTDTSGKDGTIRKVFSRTDPLGVTCVPFKAPSEDERDHDFLWRIHKVVPGRGEMAIFNRSHYEDVLVPAVHGEIDDKERKRRYSHIRDFERMLAETGTVIMKFLLHISRGEQKRRLEERLANPDKHWKFDPNDLVEREHWSAYQRLYEKAIRETDAEYAPWYIIPADSKDHRNIAVASIILETMRDMKLAYPSPKQKYFKINIE